MNRNFVPQSLPFKVESSDLSKNSLEMALNSIFHIVLTWALIFGTLYTAEYFNNYLLSAVLCVFMGGIQHRFFTIYHEAFHGNLFSNKQANKYFAMFFASFPSLSTYTSARLRHLTHHKKTATDEDPERVSHIRDVGRFSKLVFPYFFLCAKILNQMGFKFDVSEVEGRGDGSLNHKSSLNEVIGLIIFNILLIISLWFIFPNAFWVYYLGLFIFMPFCSMVRSWVEHFNEDQSEKPAFRVNIYANFIERFFFSPMSFNCHLMHHAKMGVPHYRLKKLTAKYQSQISEIEIKRTSYIKTFLENFFRVVPHRQKQG